MSYDITDFLTGLLLVSILTGLVTEAIKRILEEQKKSSITVIPLPVLWRLSLRYWWISDTPY